MAVGDEGEVLEELHREVLVAVVLGRQPEGHLQQVEAVHRHPRGAVALLEACSRRAAAATG